ncbi:MAG: HAD family phosphatase [Candidatus Magasanikbacteria bacterium]|nr:HAD family phosphatase [Candidatus Magasanikbacteria bacterium]
MSKIRIAFIFDMDGVIINSIPWHRRAWREFFIEHAKNFKGTMRGAKFSRDYFDNHINGKRGTEIMHSLFGASVMKKQTKRWDDEREAWYRKTFAPYIKPLPGLKKLLDEAHKAGIPMALATSAPPENVPFVLGKTKLQKYFSYIIDASGIKRGKPHPDMFLKAARTLKIPPEQCVVFEDAILGVAAGVNAKMPVVAVTNTYPKKLLPGAKLYIKDFSGLTLKKLLLHLSRPNPKK